MWICFCCPFLNILSSAKIYSNLHCMRYETWVFKSNKDWVLIYEDLDFLLWLKFLWIRKVCIIFFCRNLAHVHARFQMSGELLYQPRGCNYAKFVMALKWPHPVLKWCLKLSRELLQIRLDMFKTGEDFLSYWTLWILIFTYVLVNVR